MRELSLHILDILTNSISAGANLVELKVEHFSQKDKLVITFEDNGCGMTPEFVASVTSPFSTTRTTRKVGLGIPLLKELCELTGGSLSIDSTVGKGTTVKAVLVPSSIDCLPLGDVGESMAGLVGSYDQQCDFVVYFYHDERGSVTIDTREIREKVGGMPLNDPEIYLFLCDYYSEQQELILGGI
ncbi:MAG TPA: ATP-binding protein [Bacillota bacterium]|nr:ATP-binding protein [Bacillota bacterium]HPE39051.1 ATP-binding protein [Bacillota bacterium]